MIWFKLLCIVAILSFNIESGESFKNIRTLTQRSVGSVVPWPKEINFPEGRDFVSINPNKFSIHLDKLVDWCSGVQLTADRYLNNYFFDDVRPEDKDNHGGRRKLLGSIETLQVGFDNNGVGNGNNLGFNCEIIPKADMDESYTLTVGRTDDGRKFVAQLNATTNWGVMRGLETFSQLIFNLGPGFFGIQPVTIEDEPRFQHRGFMLDTARHFISLEKIAKLLDAMSFNKLNVFHWHLVDDQSFPYQSSVYPQLSEKSALRPSMVYSKADVDFVILYAATRGIRVVPELDTPGHSYTLRYIPDLLTECYDSKLGEKNGDLGPIDPTKKSSYESIKKLLREFAQGFPDQLFHAGGDEVEFDCWKSSPEINNWMQSKNMTPGDYRQVSNYYIRRLHDLVSGFNRTMVVWQEVFDDGANLPKDAIIHVWKDIGDNKRFMAELERVVSAGYQALLSSCWYLNYIDYGQDWVKFYKCDPGSAPIKPEQEHLILGGEICMWTEFVDDVNVISRTWPRASAAAERLWSPKSVNNASAFTSRLEQMRCRLNYRNIEAEPVNGPGYC